MAVPILHEWLALLYANTHSSYATRYASCASAVTLWMEETHGEFCTSRWLYDTVAPSTFCEASVQVVRELSMSSQMVLTVGAQTPKEASVVLHLGA